MVHGGRVVVEQLGGHAGVGESCPAALIIEWVVSKIGDKLKNFSSNTVLGARRQGCSKPAGCTVYAGVGEAPYTEWVI